MKLSFGGAGPARKSGVDPIPGMLFSAPIFRNSGGLVADEHYEPTGFKMILGLKDIRLALAAAD